MKTFQIIIILALVGIQLAVASPTLSGLSIRKGSDGAPDLPIVNMTWIGRISPTDATTTTLSGETAKSIWEQIIAINLNYFEENRSTDTALSVKDTRVDGLLDCKAGTMVYSDNCIEGLDYLRSLGGGDAVCQSAGNSCNRVSCSWGCAIYVCVTVEDTFEGLCKDIADEITDIISECQVEHYPDHRFFARGTLTHTDADYYAKLTWNDC